MEHTPDRFAWTKESWGRGLRADALAQVAAHVFTTRDLPLASDEGGWQALAASVGAVRSDSRHWAQHRPVLLRSWRRVASGVRRERLPRRGAGPMVLAGRPQAPHPRSVDGRRRSARGRRGAACADRRRAAVHRPSSGFLPLVPERSPTYGADGRSDPRVRESRSRHDDAAREDRVDGVARPPIAVIKR